MSNQLSNLANFDQIGGKFSSARKNMLKIEDDISKYIDEQLKSEKEDLEKAMNNYNSKAKKVMESDKFKKLDEKSKKYSKDAQSNLMKAQSEFQNICKLIDEKWPNDKEKCASKKKEVYEYILTKLYSKEDMEKFKKSMSNIVIVVPKALNSYNDKYETFEI